MTLRRNGLVLIFALPLAACASGPQKKLQGKWVGSAIENIPPSQMPKTMGWVQGMSLIFQGSKVTVHVPAEEPRTGRYEVAEAGGNKLKLRFLRANGEADEATFVLAADAKTMRWEIGDERTITLQHRVD